MNASPKRFLVFSGLASQKPVWPSKTKVPSFMARSLPEQIRSSPIFAWPPKPNKAGHSGIVGR